jgi:predicted PurR-regulated permease PerM
MADARTTSKKVAVNEGKGLAPSVTNSAIRATVGFVIVIAAAAALWYSRTAIFLGFAGILLAIVLYGASHALANLTKMPRLVALFAVVLLITGFLAFVVVGAGPKIAQQTS